MSSLVPVHYVGASDTSTDRHPGPKSFCKTHDVSLYPFMMIESKHFASAAHSGLHLIDDQHYSVLVTDASDLFDELLCYHRGGGGGLGDLENYSGHLFRRSSRLE